MKKTKNPFIILLFSIFLLPLSCQSGSKAKHTENFEAFSSQQISNFKGTYTANYNGQIYTAIVEKVPEENVFIIGGFFERNKDNWLKAFNQASSTNLETLKAKVCNKIKKKCDSESQIERYSSLEKCMEAIPIRSMIEDQNPTKDYGLLFQMISSKKIGIHGDDFETIGAHYRISNVSLNANKELSSISFQETGYVQLFRSKKFTFQKQSNDGLPALINYIKTGKEISHSVRNEPESFRSCANQ